MSNLFVVKDHYFRQAKKLKYVARSAFKLLEIQNKFQIIKPKAKVLDLGCAPGAWLQVACQLLANVKNGGVVVGVDIQNMQIPGAHCDKRVRFLRGDAFDIQPWHLREVCKRARTGFTTVLSDMCPATSGHGFSDVRQSLELGERAAQLALGRANFSLGLSTDPDDESERPKMGLSALDGEPGRRRQGLRPLDDEIGRAKVGWIVPQVLRYLDDETGRPVVRYSSVEGEIVMKDGFVHLTRGTSGRTDVDTLNNEASLAAKLADECEELMEAESAAGKDGGRPKEGANAAGDESGRPKEGGNLAGDESGRPKVGANAAADESVQSKVGASSAGGGPGHPNLERDADQGLLLPGGSFVVKLLEGEGTKEFGELCKPLFQRVAWLRPKATRPASREIYLVAMKRLPSH